MTATAAGSAATAPPAPSPAGRRVAVAGGGMTGLALAWELRKQGADVTVFDGAPSFGGLSVAATYPGFAWDRFYHVIAPQDRALQDLVGELGLGGDLRWSRSRQAVWLAGAVRPLNGPVDLLRLPGLTLVDKFRLGLLVFAGRGDGGGDAVLDGITSAEWLKRRCGERAFDRLWRHLLRCKLGDAAGRVSARFIFATLKRLSAARGKGGGERFGYVRGGYAAVLDRFVQRLQERSVSLRAGAPVTRVAAEPSGNGVAVETANGSERFDAAFLTLPNPALAAVCADLSPADRQRLAATPYLGVACTVAVGNAPLSGNYILNLCDESLALTGVIETSAIVAGDQTAGRTLVYLPRYALADSPMFALDDAAIRARALDDLGRVFPHTRNGWLVEAAVHRARTIQPLPLVGMPRVAPPRTVVEGRVFVVSNAQLDGSVLNNDDCVRLATAAAAEFARGAAAAPATRVS